MPEQTPRPAAASRKFALLRLSARRAGKCAVCRHRDRMGIELRFMAWGKPAHIAHENGIKNRASIYRHAHAANLFERRDRRVKSTYKSTEKYFELGHLPVAAVRVAEHQIEAAVRHHLAKSAFATQDWVLDVLSRNRGHKIARVAAAIVRQVRKNLNRNAANKSRGCR